MIIFFITSFVFSLCSSWKVETERLLLLWRKIFFISFFNHFSTHTVGKMRETERKKENCCVDATWELSDDEKVLFLYTHTAHRLFFSQSTTALVLITFKFFFIFYTFTCLGNQSNRCFIKDVASVRMQSTWNKKWKRAFSYQTRKIRREIRRKELAYIQHNSWTVINKAFFFRKMQQKSFLSLNLCQTLNMNAWKSSVYKFSFKKTFTDLI